MMLRALLSVALIGLLAQLGVATFVQHSGYIAVNSTQNANLFYWVVEATANVSTAPVALWLSGGPGCSGGLAMFYEHGPWSVDSENQLHNNPFSWNQYATVIYIDQPAGTGFSYANSEYIHEESQVAEEVYAFLTGFFKQYPQYTKQPFYISGESYGGRYVPAVAQYIVQHGNPFNLKGVSIGNGLVDPGIQYANLPTFALWENLINHTTYKALKEQGAQCADLINSQKWDEATEICNGIMANILSLNPDVNPMNILDHCQIQDCFDYSNISDYLNQPSVKKQIGAKADIEWEACAYGMQFTKEDRLAAFSPVFGKLLDSNIRVLAYAGDKDLVCPWNGGLNWVWNMKWSGSSEFQKQAPSIWRAPGAHHDAGVAKSYKNLTWTTILNAGHMAPHDQPAAALEMWRRWLSNTPF